MFNATQARQRQALAGPRIEEAKQEKLNAELERVLEGIRNKCDLDSGYLKVITENADWIRSELAKLGYAIVDMGAMNNGLRELKVSWYD